MTDTTIKQTVPSRQHIDFLVYGTPGPQGSKSFKGMRGGHAILLESSAKVKPWREAVKWAYVAHYPGQIRPVVKGAVVLDVIFTLARPKSTKRKYPEVKPDLSKLIRSTEDALTEISAWDDDARVVGIRARKVYVGSEGALASPGAAISIREAA